MIGCGVPFGMKIAPQYRHLYNVSPPAPSHSINWGVGRREQNGSRATLFVVVRRTLPPSLPACLTALCLCFCTLHTNEIPRINPLVQVDYVRVVDLDIGASKSDIRAISVVTGSERAGRTRACNRGLA